MTKKLHFLDMLIKIQKQWPSNLGFSFQEFMQYSSLFFDRDQSRLNILFNLKKITKSFDESLFHEAIENLRNISVDKIMLLSTAIDAGRKVEEYHIRMLIDGKLNAKVIKKLFESEADPHHVTIETNKKSKHLNPEQLSACQKFIDIKIGVVLVDAYAGTGKTMLLTDICRRIPNEKFLYLTFSKSLRDEALAKFPKNCVVKTFQSLAYDYVIRHQPDYQRKMKIKSEEFDFLEWARSHRFEGGSTMSLESILKAAVKTMKSFYLSSVDYPGPEHLPEEYLSEFRCTDEEKKKILKVAYQYWSDEKNKSPRVRFPMSYEACIKIFHMQNDKILGYSGIFFDEYQDADQIMIDIMLFQSMHTRVLFVGDRYQQIFAWRGASDAVSKIKADHRFQLVQTYRFGQQIAKVANGCLKICGAQKNIRGVPMKPNDAVHVDLDFAEPHVVLFRTNVGMLEYMAATDRPVLILEKTKKLLDMLTGVFAVYRGRTKTLTTSNKFRRFTSFDELLDYAEIRQDHELSRVCNFVRQHENIVPIIVEKLRAAPDYNAPILLSTIHGAKGKEWDRVRVYGDLRFNKKGEIEDDEEKRLLYVAVTRAREQLSISSSIATLIQNHTKRRAGASRAAHFEPAELEFEGEGGQS